MHAGYFFNAFVVFAFKIAVFNGLDPDKNRRYFFSQNILSRTLLNGLDPDKDNVLSVLIWVQTVCKDYKWNTKVVLVGQDLGMKMISMFPNSLTVKLQLSSRKL